MRRARFRMDVVREPDWQRSDSDIGLIAASIAKPSSVGAFGEPALGKKRRARFIAGPNIVISPRIARMPETSLKLIPRLESPPPTAVPTPAPTPAVIVRSVPIDGSVEVAARPIVRAVVDGSPPAPIAVPPIRTMPIMPVSPIVAPVSPVVPVPVVTIPSHVLDRIDRGHGGRQAGRRRNGHRACPIRQSRGEDDRRGHRGDHNVFSHHPSSHRLLGAGGVTCPTAYIALKIVNISIYRRSGHVHIHHRSSYFDSQYRGGRAATLPPLPSLRAAEGERRGGLLRAAAFGNECPWVND